MDTYGCGCQHNCSYCYSRALLDFRGLWNPDEPRIADIQKIKRTIAKIPQGTIVRMGGMTDCFQPMELTHRVTYETIKEMNKRRVGYLIVTKSHLIAEPEYIDILDKDLAHIQITVTTLDDKRSLSYEKASIPSKRIEAIRRLQDMGFDVAIRLSPMIEEYMDFERLNELGIEKCIIEFLRINSWIKQWFPEIDFSRYTLRQSNYYHLPLQSKIEVVEKVRIPERSICEDVTEHFLYWRSHYNPNKMDCCNLRTRASAEG